MRNTVQPSSHLRIDKPASRAHDVSSITSSVWARPGRKERIGTRVQQKQLWLIKYRCISPVVKLNMMGLRICLDKEMTWDAKSFRFQPEDVKKLETTYELSRFDIDGVQGASPNTCREILHSCRYGTLPLKWVRCYLSISLRTNRSLQILAIYSYM